MKTPLPVSAQDAADAAARIVARRREIHDPHLDEFVGAEHNPRELWRLALTRWRGVPDWVALADIDDAALLHVRSWWNWTSDDEFLLAHAERAQANRLQVVTPLGLTSGQGLVERLRGDRRKLAQLAGEPDPTERAAAPDADLTERRQRWLDRHRAELDTARADLVAHQQLGADEAYEGLRDVDGEPWRPSTMTLLIHAAVDLRRSPAVQDLPERHPVHRALAVWDALVADYPAAADR